MLKYLVTYIIMFVLWTFISGNPEQGYEKLHWMAIATVSIFSLLPVAIYDGLKKMGL